MSPLPLPTVYLFVLLSASRRSYTSLPQIQSWLPFLEYLLYASEDAFYNYGLILCLSFRFSFLWQQFSCVLSPVSISVSFFVLKFVCSSPLFYSFSDPSAFFSSTSCLFSPYDFLLLFHKAKDYSSLFFNIMVKYT